MSETPAKSRIHPGPGLLFLVLLALFLILGFWAVYLGPAMKKRQALAEVAEIQAKFGERGSCHISAYTPHPLFLKGRLQIPENFILRLIFGSRIESFHEWQATGGIPKVDFHIDFSQFSAEERHDFVLRMKRFPGGTLASQKITDADLESLGPLPSSWRIVFHQMSLSAAGVRQLSKAGQVITLDFGPSMGDAELLALDALPELQLLSLVDSAVTDAGIKGMPHFPKLIGLALNPAVTDAGMTGLGTKQTSLQILILNNAAVEDAGLKELASCQSLTCLHLTGTRITDAGLRELAPLSALSMLYLDNTAVTDQGMKILEANHPRLTHLSLQKTTVTDTGILELAGLEKLWSLEVGPAVTAAGIKAFQARKKGCRCEILLPGSPPATSPPPKP